MKIAPLRLHDSSATSFYLYGEDRDALFEAAEALFVAKTGHHLRLDVSELGQIEVARSNAGLFGDSNCIALVRNAESVTIKQGDHLLRLAQTMPVGSCLIMCAPEVSWKKAWHKKMQAESTVVQCEFSLPSAGAFRQWLADRVNRAGLQVNDEAMVLMGEYLQGMRADANRLIERLQFYVGNDDIVLNMSVIGDLLGDRAPEDINLYCHLLASRDSQALSVVGRLLSQQQVAAVQLLSWVSTRMTMLLMFRWYEAQRERNALQKAKVFGDARTYVVAESKVWSVADLFAMLQRLLQLEKQLKGTSIESEQMLFERLTRDVLTQSLGTHAA
ncbi:MAG: hypothetical protein HQM07_01715 [Zetaproteobacteria bacterium]|nr:hypothetical protein [Zetaproteobacteria bacterium]